VRGRAPPRLSFRRGAAHGCFRRVSRPGVSGRTQSGPLAAVQHWRPWGIAAENRYDVLVSCGAQPGERYKVKVMKLADYGAFVKFPSGHTSLLHISEIAQHKVRACSWAEIRCSCCARTMHAPGSAAREPLAPRARRQGLQSRLATGLLPAHGGAACTLCKSAGAPRRAGTSRAQTGAGMLARAADPRHRGRAAGRANPGGHVHRPLPAQHRQGVAARAAGAGGCTGRRASASRRHGRGRGQRAPASRSRGRRRGRLVSAAGWAGGRGRLCDQQAAGRTPRGRGCSVGSVVEEVAGPLTVASSVGRERMQT